MDIKQEEVTTLHDICVDKEELIKSIREVAVERPITIIMPMLYREIKNRAINNIVKGLNKCDYVEDILIPLSAENKEEFEKVKRFFSKLETKHYVIWCNGRKITKLLHELKEEGINVLKYKGKGRDVWIALGIASLRSYAMALHDADVQTYNELIPAKLLFPILEPELDFKFSKGYYARVNLQKNIIYGRVFRLFLHPLLKALVDEIGYEPDFLNFLRAFRYPLAGEFAMTKDVAIDVDVPGDWGIEIGILAEIYRNVARKRICQVDLGFYEHKHQELGNKESGLVRMVRDIFKTLLRVLTEEDRIQISDSFLTSLRVVYQRVARDCIRQYHADAVFNHLKYDRHLEETIVERFSKHMLEAGKEYLKKPIGARIPDWLRTVSAKRKIREELFNIVVEENEK
ncbi:MAG TPA: glucosyl-3-phosphoglycerate synthase [Thermoplasmatales archaeon]|nr:glucosyl-3-phosphoglycerate synthase [Thermoplasmatales archaeon]